ncbi:hypothetical protein F5Y18DRAFT_376520 [Xylariaceae sp. FL1019]|nr:hypothetical protein F5Y18DRAFT_376520 [Xylariaceae sp. FL1019]
MRPYFDHEKCDEDELPPIISHAAVYSAGFHRHDPDKSNTYETKQPDWSIALEHIQIARDICVTPMMIDQALAPKLNWLPEEIGPLVNIMPSGYPELFDQNWVDPQWPPEGDIGMLREEAEPQLLELHGRYFEDTIPLFAYHIWPIMTGVDQYQVLFITLSKSAAGLHFYDQLVSYAIFNPLKYDPSEHIASKLESILGLCNISIAFRPGIEDYEHQVWMPKIEEEDWSSGLRALQVCYTLVERIRDYGVDTAYDEERLFEPIRYFDADEIRFQTIGHIVDHAMWDLRCKARVVIEPLDHVRSVGPNGEVEILEAGELDPLDKRAPLQEIPKEFQRKKRARLEFPSTMPTDAEMELASQDPLLVLDRFYENNIKSINGIQSRSQAAGEKMRNDQAEKARKKKTEGELTDSE